MTVINPNSVAGINSITVASGEALSVHKSDGTLIKTIVSASGVSTFTSVSVGSATTTNNADKSINIGLGASIFQPQTNSLSLGTGGDERLRITSGGLVGINQNTPTHMLHVDSSNASDSTATAFFKGRIIRFDGAASAHSPRLNLSLDGTDKATILLHRTNDDLEIQTLTASPIRFSPNSTERAQITSDGNVGIGTDTMNAPLTVVQNDASGHIASFRQKNAGNSAQILIDSPTDNNIRPASIDLAQAGTIKWSLGQAYSAGSDRAFHIATSALSANDTNAKLTITTAGRVGISSQIPSKFLDVVGSDGTGLVQIRNLASSFSNDCYTLLINNTTHNSNMSSAGSFAVETSDTGHGTRAFTIAGDGDVGIGTALPDGSLAICHTSTTDMLMFNVPGSVGTFAKMGHNTASGTNMLDIRSEGHTRLLTNGNNESMRITSGNDVVIGGTSIGDSGSFGVQSSGAFRSVLAASTASDTLLGAISGVSNGFQIAIDASNNQNYKFHNGSQQTLTLTSGGQLLAGGTSAYNVFENSSTAPRVQVRGTNLSGSCQAWIRATADAGAPKLFLANTRSTAEAGHTVVQAGDELGQIHFAGSDGSQFVNGASIAGVVRSGTTPAADNVPGDLSISVNHGSTSTTEAVRISRGGNGGRFMLHHTDTGSYNANFSVRENSSGPYPIGAIGQSSGQGLVGFFKGDGTLIGSIGKSGDSVTFNTTSDYRLKENAVSISDGITRLKSLKPYKFNFISDSSTTLDGFFAHEVSSVVPEAVTGEKDGIITQEYIDEGKELQSHLGNPIIQSMDHSKLVPLLTAALQEAITKIETLETKVAALEGG